MQRSSARIQSLVAVALTMVLAVTLFGVVPLGAAQESDAGLSPASGHAQVIAQGVVALPQGETVWRTVRTRALLPADAPFEERPLGFVLASSGPILLVDQGSGDQARLGTGEAALVEAGTVQQRSSLGAQPVSYLSIELVLVDAAPPPSDATVLQPGQPFPAPPGLRDLDLLSDVLTADETLTVPDAGNKNVILVTDGAANVGRPGGNPVVLLAGEAASFSGELQVSVASSGVVPSAEDRAAFVVAMIGSELPAVAAPEATSPPAPTEPVIGVETPSAATATGEGSIAIQVFTCPPGMDAATVAAAACAPTIADFDVTLSGEVLAGPLTIGDAAASGDTFTWSGLPFGEYQIAEAVLPAGSTTYGLSAKGAAGGPDTGYRLTLDATHPTLAVRIYNFAPA